MNKQLDNFFQIDLPNKLSNNPALTSNSSDIYVFDLDGYGKYTLDLTSGAGIISEGGHINPGCTVSAKSSDFVRILDNPSSYMVMFAIGRLKIDNVSLALSLQSLLK